MVHTFTWQQWTEAYVREHDKWARFSLSPGGAAAIIGVTRQAVNNAINKGRLDAVRIGSGGARAVLVDSDTVEAMRLLRSTAAGRMAALALAHKRRVETIRGRR